MSEPVEGTDDAIHLAELRREFLGFILVIINNDLGRVFVSDGLSPAHSYSCLIGLTIS